MNRRILRLAIPNILSNLSVPLLGAVDTAMVGHLEDVAYLGAISVGGMIFNFLFWGFGFLRMGTTGLTAQSFGKEEPTSVVMDLSRALLVAAVGSVMLIILQDFIAYISFWVVEASPEVERFTRLYFFIRIYSAPAVLGVYALNGWFLGMQNAKYPMYVTIGLNALNIGLDVLFIYGFGMHVDGVAWGTLIARYFGLFLAVGLLLYSYRDYMRHFVRDRLLELRELKKFVTVNRDIFIRTLCLIFTFSFFTAKSAESGDIILAANTILIQLWMIISYGIDGFAYAAESLVGRFIGARDRQRLRQAIAYSFIWGISIGVAGSVVYGIFDRTILKIFTNKPEVIQQALSVFAWTIAAPLVNSFSYIWDGIFIGATASVPMRNSMIIATLLIFLPAYYLGKGVLGAHALWMAMTLFMFARGLTLSLFYPSYIMK